MRHSVNNLILTMLAGACLFLQACTQYDTPLAIAVDKEEPTLSSSDIQRKVLWINMDGAVGEVVKNSMPQDGNIARLLEKSKYSWTGLSEARTCEEKNEDPVTWATMLTGVIPEKHHIIDDSYSAEFDIDPDNPTEKVIYYPTILDYISTEDANLGILCVTPWTTLNKRYLNSATKTVTAANDEETKEVVLNSLNNDDYILTLLSFSRMLDAGRRGNGGFTSANTAYVDALSKIDGYIGEFLDAIEARKNAYYEDWLVVVTSNHGGDTDGHYGNMADATRNTFGIFYFSHYEPQEMKGESMYAALFNKEIQAIAYDTLAQYYAMGADKEFSLEFVMRNTPKKDGTYTGNNWDRIIGKDKWGLYRQRNNVVARIEAKDASDASLEASGNGFNDALWHSFVFSIGKMEGGARPFRMAYDGSVVMNKSISSKGFENDSTVFTVGGNLPSSHYIAEIRIWNKVLDDATLAANASLLNIQESNPNYKDLTSYWKFASDRITNDTIVQNSISGMLDLNFIRRTTTTEPELDKGKRISILELPNTLPEKVKSGNVMMENTLVVPQILYWLNIKVDSKVDGFTFLNIYKPSEEWREKALE